MVFATAPQDSWSKQGTFCSERHSTQQEPHARGLLLGGGPQSPARWIPSLPSFHWRCNGSHSGTPKRPTVEYK